jgi:hypothetical protein
MSRRGVTAPLAVQMEDLKKSMHNRDKRRNQDRLQRAVWTRQQCNSLVILMMKAHFLLMWTAS